jgi:hypothetical protein
MCYLRKLSNLVFILLITIATIHLQYSEAIESDGISICNIDDIHFEQCTATHDSDNDHEMSQGNSDLDGPKCFQLKMIYTYILQHTSYLYYNFYFFTFTLELFRPPNISI